MLPNLHDAAIERDSSLVDGLCHTALNARRDIREWAELELRDMLYEAGLQEEIASGVVKDEIAAAIESLRTISRIELPRAIREHEEVRQEVLNGGYTDVGEAFRRLELQTTDLAGVMTRLLRIRSFIGELGNG